MFNQGRGPLWLLLSAILVAVPTTKGLTQQGAPAASSAPAPQEAGRIAGQVTDASSGAPLAGARITILGRSDIIETDGNGQYRTTTLEPGVYSVRAALIGYQSKQKDSVVVRNGQVSAADLSLATKVIELSELVTQSATTRKTSDAGILAAQQAAPTVSDGISAEAMSRSPDSDASDAITRVTGASVVGDKFVYVRGLGERYGNTLLNGAELPSPEPLKKVVPLDLFPASLLESIVTTKAGRPDRPGDVTGAAVEIETKDFPSDRVLQFSVTQEYNSQTTFKAVSRGARGGSDLFGFDNGRRMPDGPLPISGETSTPAGERFAESIRNTWTPVGKAPLNFGLNLNTGGTIIGGDNPLGGVLSLNYSAKTEHISDRLYQLTRSTEADQEPELGYRYRQTSTVVDWGAIANFSKRFGTHQLSFRNLYSRNAEEMYLSYSGFNFDNSVTDNSHGYQVQYVERDLLQTQLAGKHFMSWLFGSRFEWRNSLAIARRDEPENRNLLYTRLPDGSEEFIRARPNYFFFRFLDDRMFTSQVDWAVPLSIWSASDAELKIGGLRRTKNREFNAQTYGFQTAVPEGDPFLRLPPDLLFAPENVGTNLNYTSAGGPPPPGAIGSADPSYEVTDNMTAAYAMIDLPMYPWLRMVGGLRLERWRLALVRGTQENPSGEPIRKENTDALWSTNLTFKLNDRMNIRAAAYRSVARPEARELDDAYYVAIGGECGFYGNSNLVRTTVMNADARWELYPSAGEIVTLGGFYKDFTQPIYEQISFSSATACSFRYQNAESARIYGLEAEFRKRLDFVGLPQFMLGTNVTLVSSEAVIIPPSVPNYVRKAPFVGQSPYLLNLSLGYASEDGGFNGTVLLNYFDDRIVRYGEIVQPTGSGVVLVPDIVELGRTSLDMKVQRRLGRVAVSASGKNLLNPQVRFVQPVTGREIIANAYTPGVSFSLGFGYDF